MFETHFGLRENPFASGHQPRFLYPSREHQEALAHLRYGIENLEPFVLITGEVGTGKTTALFEALSGLQSQASVALITNSALTRSELIEEICLRFGFALNLPVSKPQALAALERHLLALRARGERAILLLDEAQNLDRELLEEIRLLSNLELNGEKLLQVFLVGQPELEAKLSRPELRQLRQRIAVHYRLRPLNAEDTQRYIHHRISVTGGYAPDIFPADSCAEVYAVTNGIPREINQICAQAMLDAFVEDTPVIRPEHVRAAAEETAFQSVLPAAEVDPRIPPPPAAWQATTTTPVPVTTPREAAAAPMARPPAPGPSAVEQPRPTEPPAAEPTVLPSNITPEPGEPTQTPELPSAADAARWETWVASLVTPPEPADTTTTSPAAATPPPPVTPPSAPEPAAAEPAAPPPVEPGWVDVTPAGSVEPIEPIPTSPSASSRPAMEREPTPAPAGGPRYAAVSALEPAPENAPPGGGDDWRPPLWTPDGKATGARRVAPNPRHAPTAPTADAAERSNTGFKWLIGVAVVAVLGITAVLMFRFGPWAKHVSPLLAPIIRPVSDTTLTAGASDQSAAMEPATLPPIRPATGAPAAPNMTTPATSLPSGATSGTRGAAAPGTVTAANGPASATPPAPVAATSTVNARPGTTPRTPGQAPAIAGTRASGTPRPTVVQEFGIAVGTYLDRGRAEAELMRLSGGDGLTGRLAEVRQDGVTMYTVVIGAFGSRDAAERRASDLVARGLVDEARIISRTVAARP
jgi:type II secretory pathway predicted ATPase ExeA